jgi:hypothetical protein
MNSLLEAQLAQGLGDAIDAEVAPAPPPALTPSDVWDKLKERENAVQKRVKRERWSIKENFDKTVLSINQDFDRRVDDALALLTEQRHRALSSLADRTAKELKDLDLLIDRMDR